MSIPGSWSHVCIQFNKMLGFAPRVDNVRIFAKDRDLICSSSSSEAIKHLIVGRVMRRNRSMRWSPEHDIGDMSGFEVCSVMPNLL